MYQITGKQVSFRVTDFEREKLNKVAETLQIESSTDFQNAKELIFAVINKLEDLAAAEPQTIEVEKEVTVEVLPEDLQQKFAEIKGSVFDGEELTEVQMLETLIQIVNNPAPAVEIPIEKIVEKERAVGENEVLISLRANQCKILDYISDWRHKRQLDVAKLSREDVIKSMVFNEGTLTNWHGEFPTGITSKQARNDLKN